MKSLINYVQEMKALLNWPQELSWIQEPLSPEESLRDAQEALALAELQRLTTDRDSKITNLRALMIYLAIVKHLKAGGSVQFLGIGKARKLRVPLR